MFCYSARVCSNFICTNLAPSRGASYDGHTLATPRRTFDARDIINCLGGIQVLFPLLETSLGHDDLLDRSYISLTAESPRRNNSLEAEASEWELLPTSSFSDWKLEKNPVSGFLTLVKNFIIGHPVNQEHLMRGGGVAIIGELLQKVDTKLIDVNVLMAAQLFVEITGSTKQTKLLYQFYHSILFDFRIWSRSEYHLQIGHSQYIATLIMADRKYFRKKFGVQYLLDVIRQHYSNNSGNILSPEDNKTIRASLFGLIKSFLQKEVNAKEVNSITNFIFSFRKSPILPEVLDLLLSYFESKLVKDQMILIMAEPKCIDLIFCILLEESVSNDTRVKIYKLLFALLRTNKISNRHKSRLHLQEVGYLGFLYMRAAKEPLISMDEVVQLTNQMLAFDHSSSYHGILALCHHLYLADIDIKLELARKILVLVYSHPHAPANIYKHTGWHGCIARLLVKEMVKPDLDTVISMEDVISLDDELMEAENVTDHPLPPSHVIAKVSDTAKHFLPEQAVTTVDMMSCKVGTVAEEASKVLSGTSERVRSNIERAGNLVTDTVTEAGQRMTSTVNTASELLGDITNIRRQKRLSEASLDRGALTSLQFSQNFISNYELEAVDSEDRVSIEASEEDVARSRETICSTPTR